MRWHTRRNIASACEIAAAINDKTQYADWSTREDVKSQPDMSLTVLLCRNEYPPEWNEEVFEKVIEQVENFKKGEML